MKHLLITTITAVVLVGCGRSVDIWEAAEYGNIETIKHHLANGTDVNVQDFDGWTPLHWAAMEGHKKIAELLIANGADVNMKSSSLGRTPLQHAAQLGHKKIAELFIAKGADVNAKSEGGHTPVDWAESVNDSHSPKDKAAKKEIADLLRKHGGKTGAELKAEGK